MPKRGEVWLADLGVEGKQAPCSSTERSFFRKILIML